MPLPKRRHSKARRYKKRTHKKVNPVSLNKCTHCGKEKRPHKVCPHCGYYRGKKVLSLKEKEKK